MNNILEIKNLCKNYKNYSMKDVGFALPKGFIMGLIGRNGAGKTTTIRSILNMANIDGGEIKVFQLDSIKEAKEIKQNIGVVFDNLFFANHLNVKEIESQLKGFYHQWDSQAFFQYISRFNLPIKAKVGEFSRGMQMKLMLSVALSHKADLLILDEPTSGLDPVARDELLDILTEYIADENRSILFSTHITTDLERIADYITILSNGKVHFSGTKDELMEKYVIIKCWESDIPNKIKENLIGSHSYKNGFEAMLPVEYLDQLPETIDYEKANMDEILIYISKEEKK